MKYAKIRLPDNFEKGQCRECPVSYWDEDGEDRCPMMARSDECPLDIIEDEKESESERTEFYNKE